MQDKFELAAGQVYEKINPALVAMLKSLDQGTTAAGKQSDMLSIIGDISAKIANWFTKHQELINAAFVATSRWVEAGLKEAIAAVSGVYGWLQKNPEILTAIGEQTRLWGSGIKLVWDIAKDLAPAFGVVLNVLCHPRLCEIAAFYRLANQGRRCGGRGIYGDCPSFFT